MNDRQIHLIGPVKFAQLTLKRGMTSNLQLWQWLALTAQGTVAPAAGTVTMWDADATPVVEFALDGCLPVRMRAPSLNAREGLVAVEELALVYENHVRQASRGQRLRRGSRRRHQRVGRDLRECVGRDLWKRRCLAVTSPALPGRGTARITEWNRAGAGDGEQVPSGVDMTVDFDPHTLELRYAVPFQSKQTQSAGAPRNTAPGPVDQ